MVDALVAHRAVEIVGAVGQRRLRRADAQRDPIGLDVIEIVEHQPADGHDAQVVQSRDAAQVRQGRILGMERQRDERLKAAGLVLQMPQSTRWSTRCSIVSMWP